MRFWKSGLAAAALITAVTPALADNVPAGTLVPGAQLAQMPPPPMMGVNWTGFYLGVNAGIGWGNSQATFNNAAIANSPNFNIHGPLGGATMGYNWQINPGWVLGLEGDFDGSGISGSQNCPGTNGPFSCHASDTWLASARLRLGWTPMNSSWLFFVTGGGAFGDIKGEGVAVGAGATGLVKASTTTAGWTAGAGAEYMVSPAWSLKLEYRYSDLGSQNFSNGNTNIGGVGVGAVRVNESFNTNAILAGLNYHFGAPPPPPPPPPPMAMPPAAPVVFIVFFDWDKSTITPEGMGIIQQAANAYKSGAPVQIQVTGYTDRSGSPGYNQRLSERRANNVAKAMAALGVPPAQMTVSGRGENDNRVPTANGVREPQNRRVEIVKP
jgi:OOP family OmpA-OmpF porin